MIDRDCKPTELNSTKHTDIEKTLEIFDGLS